MYLSAGRNIHRPLQFSTTLLTINQCTMGLSIALRISKVTRRKGSYFAQSWSKSSEVVWHRWKNCPKIQGKLFPSNICSKCDTYGRKTWMAMPDRWTYSGWCWWCCRLLMLLMMLMMLMYWWWRWCWCWWWRSTHHFFLHQQKWKYCHDNFVIMPAC